MDANAGALRAEGRWGGTDLVACLTTCFHTIWLSAGVHELRDRDASWHCDACSRDASQRHGSARGREAREGGT